MSNAHTNDKGASAAADSTSAPPADRGAAPNTDPGADHSPDPRPDPSLTLPARALAGSPACLNCATPLRGPFCHYCGQPDRNFMRFFPALLREVLSEAFEFDSRFMRTMKPLLFQPGRLTRDYLDGRRFRYTPPLRLYLFSSIVFFVLAAFLSTDAIQDNIRFSSQTSGVDITVETEEDLARLQEAVSMLPEGMREELQAEIDAATVKERQQAEFFEAGEINFNGQPWHPETNPVAIGWAPRGVNNWINEEIAASPEKVRRINEDPSLIVAEIFDLLPATMFVLLPVVALVFKFWYLFSGRFYIEHLILALHNHSFLFVMLIGTLVTDALRTFAVARGMGLFEQAMTWVSYGIGLWIPIYLVGSLRTVYRQGWFMTLGKAFMIGLSYLTMLGLVTSLVAILGFVLV